MKKIILLFLLSFSISSIYAQEINYRLSSHILDVSTGLPAKQVKVKLALLQPSGNWQFIAQKETDEHGRIKDFLPENKSQLGVYKLTFLVDDYFKRNAVQSFYPFIEIVFELKDNNHYHVPITLSPFGYSTYRGN
eukprot:Opistho-1_new@66662